MLKQKHQLVAATFESAQVPSYLRHSVSPAVRRTAAGSFVNSSGRSTPDLSHPPLGPRTAGDGAETTEHNTQHSDSLSILKPNNLFMTPTGEQGGISPVHETQKKTHGPINPSIAAKFSEVRFVT